MTEGQSIGRNCPVFCDAGPGNQCGGVTRTRTYIHLAMGIGIAEDAATTVLTSEPRRIHPKRRNRAPKGQNQTEMAKPTR